MQQNYIAYIAESTARQKYGAVNLDKNVRKFYQDNNVLNIELLSGEILKMPALPVQNLYYFTFGFGSNKQKNYVKIVAENSAKATLKMVNMYGNDWANLYTAEEFKGQCDRFGLVELF